MLYKNIHPTILKQREAQLVAQMVNLGHLQYYRDTLHGDARMALTELFVQVGNDLRAVRAELAVIRGMGLGTAPLTPVIDLHDAPTVRAALVG